MAEVGQFKMAEDTRVKTIFDPWVGFSSLERRSGFTRVQTVLHADEGEGSPSANASSLECRILFTRVQDPLHRREGACSLSCRRPFHRVKTWVHQRAGESWLS